MIKEILPGNVEIVEEYIYPLKKSRTGCPMIFDIYVPSLNLVFEYQGYQHYFDHVMFGIVKARKERDNERFRACASLGLALVEVPYWWHRDKDSLYVILHKHRPDIVFDPQRKTKGVEVILSRK